MLQILNNRTYRRLFAAQAIALLGTGLATVALALLAYQLAGDRAGTVLGTALFIKMVAYVAISPLAGALASLLPRKTLLVATDLVRVGVVLTLPFVGEIWQVYSLVFVLQSASALFTPTFQATIPDILPDEKDYTRALSLSRLAYDLENLLSPAIAAALLLVMTFHALFAGTAFGFAASAALVLSCVLPAPPPQNGDAAGARRALKGLRIYLATPRLRGLLALNLSAAAAGAMVIVNTVVIVRGELARSDSELALAMAFFGAGSMLAALALPHLLERSDDRPVMVAGAAALGLLLAVFAIPMHFSAAGLWLWLLGTWLPLGVAYAMVLTPGGRLLRRSAHAHDRPAVYAAQFALSHACWLVTYPLAGWLAPAAGMPASLLVLSAITIAGALAAARLWPAGDEIAVEHRHDDLPADHPHLREAGSGERLHVHPYVIDDLHRSWPSGRP